MENIRWERIAAVLLVLVLGGGLLYGFLRFVFPFLLPFLIAWLLALIIRPLATKIARHTHVSQKLCAVVLLVAVIGLGGWGIWFAAARLVTELGGLVNRLLAEGEGISETLENAMVRLEELIEGFGFLHTSDGSFRKGLYNTVTEMVTGVLTSVSARLPDLAGGVLSSLPSVFLVVGVTVISCFYFCADGEKIGRTLVSILPQGIRKRLPTVREKLREISRKYLRAYLLLLGVTFVILLIGFLILGVEYAFLLALVTAVVDLLPVLGVGTVLIPWAVIVLLQKNFYLGFGLLILYLVVLLVRQIAEPKLVGHSLGLHPLLSLFASYVGFCLFGLLGMILAPPIALLCKNLFARGNG
ncbi:MAG: sporulation integral membrane protein YtvI [Clostridia bacterium]|nr:sporulation integral membrane protein YtvI [Clostridia bacterium]